jgi:hypothetical protein
MQTCHCEQISILFSHNPNTLRLYDVLNLFECSFDIIKHPFAQVNFNKITFLVCTENKFEFFRITQQKLYELVQFYTLSRYLSIHFAMTID